VQRERKSEALERTNLRKAEVRPS